VSQSTDENPSEREDLATPWSDRDHAALAAELGATRASGESRAVTRLTELLGVVWRLRDADGCAWDRKQTVESMASNLIEEAYEAVEAISDCDDAHIAEELGDVLMNVFLIARIGEQEGRFDLSDVVSGISEKLVRRHPHVFGPSEAGDAEQALASWNESKALEKDASESGVLDGVSDGLPALLVASKLGKAAAGIGFDWPGVMGALDKLREEVGELETAAAEYEKAGDSKDLRSAAGFYDRVEDELGDVLFSAVNVARKTGVDPELALRRTLGKFRRRFASVEAALGEGMSEASLEDMEKAWRAAAATERPVQRDHT
jgi:MazG family protein